MSPAVEKGALLPIAFGIALASVVLLAFYLARRYPNAPKRVPMHVGYDGRPGKYAPRAVLWLGPAILGVAVVVVGAALLLERPHPEQIVALSLVFVAMAEVAWLLGWLADRQIELARKMTFRIAPSRLVLVLLPLLGTIVATLVAAELST